MSLQNPIPIDKQINVVLNHANYSLWRFKALRVLAVHRLTGYLDGTNLCPSRLLSDGTTNIAVEYWHRQDQFIQVWLLASLSITIISDLGRCETAQQIWDRLEIMHNNNSLPRVDELMLEVQTIQRGNATCGDYLKRIGVIVERLRLVGAQMSDQDLVFYTLQGLGPEFEIFISDVTGQSAIPLTMANLHYLLLVQANHRTAHLYFTAHQPVGKQAANQPVIAQQAPPSDNSSIIGKNFNQQPQFRSFGSPETCYLAEALTREITREAPNVNWDSIKGLDNAKNILKETVVMPIKYPKKFTGILSPAKGILLFGPPGTGKTMLAKAVATKCKTTFFDISASPSVREWRGDPQILVKVIFKLARPHAPSTIFLDNIDSIISQHNEASRCLHTELLFQMDGLAKTNDLVFVLAATNLPWELDAAILRRLTKKIMVPLPESEARCAIFKELLPSTAGNPEISYESMVKITKGYSVSDIRVVCQEAIMHSLRTSVPYLEAMHDHDPDEGLLETVPVKPEDIAVALLISTTPSEHINEELYRKYNEDHGTKSWFH